MAFGSAVQHAGCEDVVVGGVDAHTLDRHRCAAQTPTVDNSAFAFSSGIRYTCCRRADYLKYISISTTLSRLSMKNGVSGSIARSSFIAASS